MDFVVSVIEISDMAASPYKFNFMTLYPYRLHISGRSGVGRRRDSYHE
jgi:hypothetical protein